MQVINERYIQPRAIPGNIFGPANFSICKIRIMGFKEVIGSGFFLDLTRLINKKCLVTNNHVITKELIDAKADIIIETNKTNNIKLDIKERLIKNFEEYDKECDISIIEILDKDKINDGIRYLDYDPNYYRGYNQYIHKDIFILHYALGMGSQLSLGKIIRLKGSFSFEHNLDTDNGSSGSPIILYDRTHMSLIGVHKGRYQNNNNLKIGIFIGTIINILKKEIYLKFDKKLENNNTNEISSIHSKIDQVSEKIQEFRNKYFNAQNNIEKRHLLDYICKTLEDHKYLFILILGKNQLSNLNILNGLIENHILSNEVKNKNIIIRYSKNNDYILRKVKLKDQISLELNGEIIGIGFDQIKTILNDRRMNEIDKEEFIYEIDIKIKFIDDNNIQNDLKEKICFINLPEPDLIKNISAIIKKNCSFCLDTIDYTNLNNNLKFIGDKYKEIIKEKNENNPKEIIESLFLINYNKDENIADDAFERIENDLKKFSEDLTKEKNVKTECIFLNIELYEKYMINYFESLDTFIRNEYIKYNFLLENNLENIKSFSEYLIDELNRYLTNYIPSNISSSQTMGDNNIEDSLRENLKEYYSIRNNDLDQINEKFLEIKKYLSKDFKDKIKLFIDKLKIIILESKDKGNKVFRQKIENYNKHLDKIFDSNSEENNYKKELEEINNIYGSLKNKNAEINQFIENDFGNLISILDVTINNIKRYNINSIINNVDVEEKIENYFRGQLNTLYQNLNEKINELSNNSKKNLQDFYDILCKINNLINNDVFFNKNTIYSFNQFINSNNYQNFIKNTSKIKEFSNKVQQEINNANTFGYYDFFEYIKGKFDNKKYNTNIINYLKKEVLKSINDDKNSLINQNTDYKSNIKNNIDELYYKAERSIKNKQKELNNKIIKEEENNKKKKRDLEEIKNYINSLL